MSILHRLMWQLRYARLALRSRYQFTPWSAWSEASASWEMNNDERGDEPIPTPREAISQDAYEWSRA
jgi:hypothetical protein